MADSQTSRIPKLKGTTKAGGIMKKNLLIAMMIVVSITFHAITCAGCEKDVGPSRGVAADPYNTTYVIEDRSIALIEGRSEVEAAPGSATRTITSVFGKPVYGDLDGNRDEDAVVLLVHDPGGSGTFYYVAAALNGKDDYRGTNAVLLGDRVTPQDVEIRNGVVVVKYTDRRPEEPMSASPSVNRSIYLTLQGGRLAAIEPLGEGEQVLGGWVTIGHEVRSFAPCSRDADHWLLGNSPALQEIVKVYRETLPNPRPYTPLFMTLAGRFAEPPTDGFGADYESAFFATQLVRVSPKGNCRSEHIVVDSPGPGAMVTSPLRVRGYARGTWFFEGDFPIVLKDASGKVIAKGFATAQNGWMTTKFVPFAGTIEFKKPAFGGRGTLILQKDNPTDLRKFDDALNMPVFFK